MKYELLESKIIQGDNIYKIKCSPGKIGKFFGKKETIETLIFKGDIYNLSGHKVFYDIYGDKNSKPISYWLNSKLHYDKYTNEEKKKERITFTTNLIPLNVKNSHGRIYMDNENLRQQIDELNERCKLLGVIYGEYDPLKHDSMMHKVSHTIKNVRIEGDNVIGDITIMNCYYGKLLKEEYKYMFFRPRSIGTIDENGLVFMKKLFTFDAIYIDGDEFLNMENVK